MGELYTLFTIRASSVYQLAVLGLKRAITCLAYGYLIITPLALKREITSLGFPSYHP